VASVAQVTVGSADRDLIWDLRQDSQVLDRIRDSFRRLLDRRTFNVWSFVEELPMVGMGKVHFLHISQNFTNVMFVLSIRLYMGNRP
jgi:hypothetical protein